MAHFRSCAPSPPKSFFMAYHAWVCRMDRIRQRGEWLNFKICNPWNSNLETTNHLQFRCRYSRCIWLIFTLWLGLHDFHPEFWSCDNSVDSWWMNGTTNPSIRRKVNTSLAMLIYWELRGERNTHLSHNV